MDKNTIKGLTIAGGITAAALAIGAGLWIHFKKKNSQKALLCDGEAGCQSDGLDGFDAGQDYMEGCDCGDSCCGSACADDSDETAETAENDPADMAEQDAETGENE